MIEIMAGGFLLIGAVVVLIGGIGILRLPDFFCRLHSVGTIDTLGAWLVLLGLFLLSGNMVNGFKVVLIGILLFFISPVASHAVARAALQVQSDKKSD